MTGNCGLKTAATTDGMFHRCYQRPEYQELYGYGSKVLRLIKQK